MKRSVSYGVLFLLVLAFTGCVWTRLLSFKNQLADFERYFKVENRQGLTLVCQKPVLLASDIRYLAEVAPTTVITNSPDEDWCWRLEKVPPPGPPETGNYDLTFVTGFTQQKLTRITFPERFLVMMPEPMVLTLLRSMGHAKIDQKQRSATVKWEDKDAKPPEKDLSLTRAQVTELLGAPNSMTVSDRASTSLYKYRLKSPSLRTNEEIRAQAKFTFDTATEKVTKLNATYAGLRIDLDFSSLNPPPKP